MQILLNYIQWLAFTLNTYIIQCSTCQSWKNRSTYTRLPGLETIPATPRRLSYVNYYNYFLIHKRNNNNNIMPLGLRKRFWVQQFTVQHCPDPSCGSSSTAFVYFMSMLLLSVRSEKIRYWKENIDLLQNYMKGKSKSNIISKFLFVFLRFFIF